jgi:predicted metal-binding protein
MRPTKKIGIVICDRYRRCAGGKCFRAMRNREGAFDIYADCDLELVGFTTCDGCPGGKHRISRPGDDQKRRRGHPSGHGLVVGYPRVPIYDTFKRFLEARFGVRVVRRTHPIPT